MFLSAYLKPMSREQRADFARRCGTTLGHMVNVANGSKPCGTALAVAIARVSAAAVTRQELRPLDYWLHWPDLPPPPGVVVCGLDGVKGGPGRRFARRAVETETV